MCDRGTGYAVHLLLLALWDCTIFHARIFAFWSIRGCVLSFLHGCSPFVNKPFFPAAQEFPAGKYCAGGKKGFFCPCFLGRKRSCSGSGRVSAGSRKGHLQKGRRPRKFPAAFHKRKGGGGNCFLLPERLNFSWSPPPPDDKFRPAYLVGNFLVLSWGGINQAAVSRGGETKRSDCA